LRRFHYSQGNHVMESGRDIRSYIFEQGIHQTNLIMLMKSKVGSQLLQSFLFGVIGTAGTAVGVHVFWIHFGWHMLEAERYEYQGGTEWVILIVMNHTSHNHWWTISKTSCQSWKCNHWRKTHEKHVGTGT